MKVKKYATEVIDLVLLGKEYTDMSIIEKKEDNAELATQALQLVFLGHTGRFRFPFAHYPDTSASSASLFIVLWEACRWLMTAAFKTDACVADSGENSRGAN